MFGADGVELGIQAESLMLSVDKAQQSRQRQEVAFVRTWLLYLTPATRPCDQDASDVGIAALEKYMASPVRNDGMTMLYSRFLQRLILRQSPNLNSVESSTEQASMMKRPGAFFETPVGDECRNLENTTHTADVNSSDVAAISNSSYFNEDWYLRTYPDVAMQGMGAAQHYLSFGYREGRDPSPNFSTGDYFLLNSDVEQAAMNPLLHYIYHGEMEGRETAAHHAHWSPRHQLVSPIVRQSIDAHLASLTYQPKLSIIMPTYETPLKAFEAAVASVLSQTYANWELCIADDCSSSARLKSVMQAAADDDRRIKIAWRTSNGGICDATNTALDMADGEFVCFLDHDDILHENALYEVVAYLNMHPEKDLVYTDADCISDDGIYFNPYFKSDFNEDLLLGHNMVAHFSVYRRATVTQLGGMRAEYQGSQDYDLALRVVAAAGPKAVGHIPAVLYHWRRSREHSSFSDRAADICQDAARRAVADYLRGRDVLADVVPSPLVPAFNRVVRPLPDPAPAVSIVLFSEDGEPDDELLVQTAADLVLRTNYAPIELLVVVSQQKGDRFDLLSRRLKRLNGVRIVEARTSPVDGFHLKETIDAANGDVLVLAAAGLRPKEPDWLNELVAQALRPEVGMVAPTIVAADGAILHAGRIRNAPHGRYPFKYGYSGYFGMLALTREVWSIDAVCICVRKNVAAQLGSLQWSTPAIEAASVTLRGIDLRTIVTPFAPVVQRRAEAIDDLALVRDAPQSPAVEEDPFYSPYLSLETFFDIRAAASRRIPPWAAERRRIEVRNGQTARAEALLAGISPTARLVEVGASYSPIAPRAEGWNTRVIDHAPREVLVAKYGGEPDIWVERIEDVDFIWRDGSIADAVPRELHGTFDVLIASHMIEHTTDLVAFLTAAQRIVAPDGQLILATPDKRFCFDYFRALTMTSDVLEAHEQRRTRHTRRTAYAHWAHTVRLNGYGAWGQDRVEKLAFSQSFAEAQARLDGLAESGRDYVDLHNWTFTPSSFALILLELARLGLCDWTIDRITPAIGCEFHAWLRRGAKKRLEELSEQSFDDERMQLLRRMLKETAEQVALAQPLLANLE